MIQNRFNRQPKQKEKSNDCVIEIKKTKTGKKIKISGKCSKEEIKLFSEQNGLNLEE